MRVAFDGHALTSPAGGVRRYVTQLFGAMADVDPSVELLAVGAAPDAEVPAWARVVAAAPSLPTNLGWALTGLPLSLRRVQPDVVHAPAYTAPFWGTRPLVLTIHDVSYARHPEWYPYRRDPLRRLFYQLSARRADRVITDSHFSRDEIVSAYGLDSGRIDVIPLGVAALFSAGPAQPRELVVLHVGDLHVRRNLPMLLDVVIELRRQRGAALAGLRLSLVGRDLGVLSTLVAQAQAAGVPEALEYLGQTDDEQLSLLYRRAGVFAYPSRYEGFGLPVLEAMASGTPVVSSSAGAVPEVAGDAGLTASPDDGRAWRDAIEAILIDPSRAAGLSTRGRDRAAAFTWEATAERTLATYRRVMSTCSHGRVGE